MMISFYGDIICKELKKESSDALTACNKKVEEKLKKGYKRYD